MTTDLKVRSDLYELDLAAWLVEQAALARAGRAEALDLANLAEELDDLGRNLKRGLRSQLRRVVLHLLKWRYQPERRSTSWVESIDDGRSEIADILADSPSLRGRLAPLLAEAWPAARAKAARQTGLPLRDLPADCPFKLADILDPDYWPDDH